MNQVKRFLLLIGCSLMLVANHAEAKIKNIIFDLGGVILDIDYIRGQDAFAKIGGPGFAEAYSQKKQSDLFDRLEIGAVTGAAFRREAKQDLALHGVSDEAFDAAWNAMLIAWPQKKLDLLAELGKDYKIFLFSNTNEIHYACFSNLYTQMTGKSFETFNALFAKAYYSHTFGMRKPHPEAFTRILEENGLKAVETLFVDDSPQHLVGAKAAGLQTLLITKEQDIFYIPKFVEGQGR